MPIIIIIIIIIIRVGTFGQLFNNENGVPTRPLEMTFDPLYQ